MTSSPDGRSALAEPFRAHSAGQTQQPAPRAVCSLDLGQCMLCFTSQRPCLVGSSPVSLSPVGRWEPELGICFHHLSVHTGLCRVGRGACSQVCCALAGGWEAGVILIKKLGGCGIDAYTVRWIADWLKGRTQRVVVDGSYSTLGGSGQRSPPGLGLGACAVQFLHQRFGQQGEMQPV